MAPFTFQHTTATVLTVVLGFLFGFVLERAGFGNSRNLAAQFYLHDMRVLKVMFTAIVTAMLLVFFTSALGWLDFSRVWVPPTYLWPGVLGGFILGLGFIIGGYCPGTSLVAVSTFKLDALFYAAGVGLGMLAFGETAPAFWGFFHGAGDFGRKTLFDLLGIDAGWVVFGVVLMAVGAFAFAEFVERMFARQSPPRFSPPARRLRWLAVGLGATLAAVTVAVGQPSVTRKLAWCGPALEQSIRQRKIHIDPAELLALVHNNRAQVVLADVRSQADYNVFHLADAEHVTPEQLDSGWPAGLPSRAVVVVMSNDEQAANEAWKHLAVQLNSDPHLPVAEKSRVYVLAGGINRWLDIYRDRRAGSSGPETVPEGDDTLRHRFPSALGDREAAARPEIEDAPSRPFVTKVKAGGPTRLAGGGCG